MGRSPNTIHTVNLTSPDLEGKQNPHKSRAALAAGSVGWAGGVDRRRRGSVRIARTEADRLLTFAEYLPVSDAMVIRELLGSGRTVAEVSRLLGVSRHTVRSRVKRLLLRTSDPAFRYVVSRRLRFGEATHAGMGVQTARLGWPEEWGEPTRAAAQICVLEGCSCRAASKRTSISYHVLRREVTMLRELGRVWRTMPRTQSAA